MRLQKYDSYKDSGVEWLGEIPSEWEVKSLKYILSFTTGGTPSSHISGYYDGNEPWVTIADIDGKYINKTHFISKNGAKNANMILSPKGSLLYSFKLSVGQVAFTSSDVYTNEAIISIHPHKNLNLNFWYYLLPIFVIKNANTNIYGAFLLNQDLIKNSTLLFPPFQEQQKIALFLDTKTQQLDKAIKQKEKLIKLLKERKQIVINEAVTKGLDKTVTMKDSGVEWLGEIPKHWEVNKLKYIFNEINKRSETGEEELLSLSKYKGVIPKSSLDERAGMAKTLIGYKKVYYNNLVINKMQAVNGLLAVSKIEGITSPDYSVYKVKSNQYNIDYYGLLLNQSIYLSEFKKVVTGVMEGFIRLYTDDLYNIIVQVPPKQEQKQIVNFIENQTSKIDNAIDLQQKQIDKLKEYKTSLIDSIVTGKVRVYDE